MVSIDFARERTFEDPSIVTPPSDQRPATKRTMFAFALVTSERASFTDESHRESCSGKRMRRMGLPSCEEELPYACV